MRFPPINMLERTYGRWLVIAKAHKTKGAGWHWLCRCSCGNQKVVSGHNLRAGITRSCGCLIREITSKRRKGQRAYNFKGGSIGAQGMLLTRYRFQARAKEVPFELDRTTAMELFAGDCHYCGCKPAQKQGITNRSVHTLPFIYNGIDRLNNSLGYVVGNVVSCCGRCNMSKGDRSYEEFVAWIGRVHEHLSRRNALTPPSALG